MSHKAEEEGMLLRLPTDDNDEGRKTRRKSEPVFKWFGYIYSVIDMTIYFPQ